MSLPQDGFVVGHGRMNFEFGFGAQGTCGDVSLTLRCWRSEPPSVAVDWQAPENIVPDFARQEIVACTTANLRAYLAEHSVGALQATITGAAWSAERRNELNRASFWAMHKAVLEAGLPPPAIFVPPSEFSKDT